MHRSMIDFPLSFRITTSQAWFAAHPVWPSGSLGRHVIISWFHLTLTLSSAKTCVSGSLFIYHSLSWLTVSVEFSIFYWLYQLRYCRVFFSVPWIIVHFQMNIFVFMVTVCFLKCVTGGLLHELSNEGARQQFDAFLEELLLPQMVQCAQVK